MYGPDGYDAPPAREEREKNRYLLLSCRCYRGTFIPDARKGEENAIWSLMAQIHPSKNFPFLVVPLARYFCFLLYLIVILSGSRTVSLQGYELLEGRAHMLFLTRRCIPTKVDCT